MHRIFLILGVTMSMSLFATTWDTPVDISGTSGFISETQISVNDSEDGIGVWHFSDNTPQNIIQAANLSAGTWGSVTDLSNSLNYAETPQVAVNASGVGIVVWSELVGTDYLIMAATYDGSTWQSSVALTVSGVSYEPQISINSSGDAIAVWTVDSGSDSSVQASVYSSGVWGSVATLSSASSAELPQIGFSDLGTAIAVWQEFDGTNTVISSSLYSGTWGSPVTLSDNSFPAANPQISINSLGNAIVVWERQNSSSMNIIQAIDYTTLLGWGTVVDISDSSDDSFSAKVAMNVLDNAVSIWSYFDGTTYQIKSALLTGGIWSSTTQISNSGEDTLPGNVSMNNTNQAIAVWQSNTGSAIVVEEATFTVGWSSPQTISGSEAYAPDISMNNTGDAYAIWALNTSGTYVAQADHGTLP